METETFYSNNRRVRANRHIRELTATVQLSHRDFIQPLFVDETISERTPISNLNKVFSDTIGSLLQQIEADLEKGVSKFLLFPVVAQKSDAFFDFSFVKKALKAIKNSFGNQVWIATDVCLCAYTDHGHCGILNHAGTAVLNHETTLLLSDYALQLAREGADCIAPSDMMDGRIKAIRQKLNTNGYDNVTIMSYASKFSSQFYGPFRDACKSSPRNNHGLSDRKTYQISPYNRNDGLLSAERDIEEGADIIMVKPAVHYLDVIHELSQSTRHPIAAYHVSGEYQAVELLAQHNLAERAGAHSEVWTSLKRAGATVIISYAARHAKEWIENIKY